MALTYSNQTLSLGDLAPNFSLVDVFGIAWSLDEFKDFDAVVVAFVCNHCPYVQLIAPEFARMGNALREQNIGVVAINSNDTQNYPEDSHEKMKEYAQKWGFHFPYLFDETQKVAKSYDAQCTPEFYLFDAKRALVYHGAFDDAKPGNDVLSNGRYLQGAIDALKAGKQSEAHRAMGCGIKWMKD